MDRLESLMAQRLSPKRYNHSLGVAQTAVELAESSGVEREKAWTAGLVHDYARELPAEQLVALARKLEVKDDFALNYPELLHGPVGAYLIKLELGIEDPEILVAVTSHTLGRRKMGKLEQIIYLADMIEPARNYHGVDSLRQQARSDFHSAVLSALDHTLRFLLEEGKPIHIRTIEARNYLLMGGE